MMKGLSTRLGKINILDEILEENTPPEGIDELFDEDDKIEQTSLFKIPKYFESYIFYGTSIMFNAILFNLIILPIKTLVMTFRVCLSMRENIWKLKIYYMKILIMILGVLIKKFLENSFPIFLIHHKLRSLSGMKIFTFIRIIEFLNVLMNKYNKDNDIQLLSILRQPKLKQKIITFFIILFALFLNIVTFWSYMISLSIVLNDPNNFIFPLFLKLNYIEMKKSGKTKKKKKILDVILFEIYDRFFVFFSLFLVLLQNYFDNKINSHNFVDYCYRVGFLLVSEVVFDWVRNIIVFKISVLKAKLIKTLTFEMVLFHEKLKYNAYHANGGNGSSMPECNSDDNFQNEYLKVIEKGELKYFNKNNEFQKYTKFLDTDNILCIQLQNNILIYCVIVIYK